MTDIREYQDACARASAARAQLKNSLGVARMRIMPDRLKADVRDKIVQSAVDAGQSVQTTVKKHPVAASATGIALIAYLARRPLRTFFHRLFVRSRDEQDNRSTSETDNG